MFGLCVAGFLMLRTLALSGTFAYATSTAARISVDATAAYEICVQIWLASSLLADALAVAVQTLLAKSYSSRNVAESKTVRRSHMRSVVTGIQLSSSCDI
jgi:Na+-driven multidrug efflux pump